MIGENPAVIGDEIGLGILGGDPALQGEAVEDDLLLLGHSGATDPVTLGELDLRLDQIDAGHLLGDGVLDLNPRIDLDEIEGAGLGVDQELDGAGVLVTGGPGQRDGGVGQALALAVVEERGRRPLDHLLMPALHRAVALIKVNHGAMTVAENLHLQMARPAHQLFEVNLAPAAGQHRLAPAGGDVGQQLVGGLDHPHAPAAAAPAGFQHHRITDGFSEAGDLGIVVLGQRLGGRHHRHPGGHSQCPGRHLVAQDAHCLAARPDEDDPGLAHRLGEVGVFREEAIARVDGVDLGLACHPDDVVDVEIGLDRPAPLADAVALVGLEAVQRQLILLGIDRDGGDLQLVGRPQHPDGDFAPVGDQQAPNRGNGFGHGGGLLGTRWGRLERCSEIIAWGSSFPRTREFRVANSSTGVRGPGPPLSRG